MHGRRNTTRTALIYSTHPGRSTTHRHPDLPLTVLVMVVEAQWREFRPVGLAIRAAPEWMIWVRLVPGGLLRRRYRGRAASSG